MKAGFVEPWQLVPLEEAAMSVSLCLNPRILWVRPSGAVLACSLETLRSLVAVLEKELPGILTPWTRLPKGLPDQILGCPRGFLIRSFPVKATQ